MRSLRKTAGSKLPTAWEQGRGTEASLPLHGWIRVAADQTEPRGGTCDGCRRVFARPAHILRHHSCDGVLRLDEPCSRELRVKPQQAEPKPPARSRATKRLQWLARAWKRGSGFDGPLSLPADGYVTTVWPRESGWRFEIRPVGHAEVCQAGAGYASDDAARLAAFDAITELLQDKSPRPKPARVQSLVGGWTLHV